MIVYIFSSSVRSINRYILCICTICSMIVYTFSSENILLSTNVMIMFWVLQNIVPVSTLLEAVGETPSGNMRQTQGTHMQGFI